MMRIVYSYKGILLAGLTACLLLQAFTWLVLPVLVIIGLFFIVSTTVLIKREGMKLKNLFGVFLIDAYILGNFFCVILPYMMHVPYRIRFWLEMTEGYFDCMLIGTVIMGGIAASHVPAKDKDFYIILGCSIAKDGGLLPLLKHRTNRAIRLAWDQEIATGKQARYVPSGGKGSDEIISEGAAMELYLLSHGAESDEVLPEKKSRNTYENLIFSRQVIDNAQKDARCAFVTSSFHVLRSGMISNRLGMFMEGAAARVRWYYSANASAREFVAIHGMYAKIHVLMVLAIAVLSLTIPM